MKKILILILLTAFQWKAVAQTDSIFDEAPTAVYTLESVPNVYEMDRRMHVSDPTYILSDQARATIDHIFTQLEDSTGIQAAVVMLPSIGEADIFDFAYNLFKDWGIGEKERDNGLLILYVADQRKIRFEVGYGLEGPLPDAICKRIQTQRMLPAFKAGDVDAGMVQGAKAIYDVLESSMNPNKAEGETAGAIAALMVLIVMVLVFVWLIKSTQQKALTCRKCGTKGALKCQSRDTYRASDGRRHKKSIYQCSHCGAVEVRDTIQDDDDDSAGGLLDGIIIGSMLGGGRRGGFGGSFGGGSIGGSFGGGSSGGGGSTSGW